MSSVIVKPCSTMISGNKIKIFWLTGGSDGDTVILNLKWWEWAPASIKSLLDHLCVHWMVHRPEPEFFKKTAVIITNSVGAPNGSAQKDVKTSLNWMGLSRVYTCGAPMMGDIFLDEMTVKHKKMLAERMKKLAAKTADVQPCMRMNLKVNMLFGMAKMQHSAVLKTEKEPSLDNAHYIMHGWIKGK